MGDAEGFDAKNGGEGEVIRVDASAHGAFRCCRVLGSLGWEYRIADDAAVHPNKIRKAPRAYGLDVPRILSENLNDAVVITRGVENLVATLVAAMKLSCDVHPASVVFHAAARTSPVGEFCQIIKYHNSACVSSILRGINHDLHTM